MRHSSAAGGSPAGVKMRPPRNRIPTVSEGRPWLVAKMAFERAYLAFARRGKLVPTALGW